MQNKELFLSVSILSSDFKNLEKEIISLNHSGIDEFHLDVMDGNFVESISFGDPIIKAVRSLTSIPIEAHLMVDNPNNYVKNFSELGVDIFTFHIESKSNILETISNIKKHKMKVGIAINPDTPTSMVEPYIDQIERILFMTVYPGKGGQKYMEKVNDKILEFSKKLDNQQLLLAIDGGVKIDTIYGGYNAGARLFVSGTGILNSELGYKGAVIEFNKIILG